MYAHSSRKPEILALIPARGGSAGIPDKNIADLGGHPLIAYSVRAALRCPGISRVVVSTDSERIAEAARRYGAETPFLRPASIADGHALVGDAVRHALNALRMREGYRPDCLVVLFPTHPFRDAPTLELLTAKLIQGHREVLSVRQVAVGPATHFLPDGDALTSLHGRQAAQVCYRRYGYYTGYWLEQIPGLRGQYIKTLLSRPELVDIDTPDDLESANAMLRSGEVVPTYL